MTERSALALQREPTALRLARHRLTLAKIQPTRPRAHASSREPSLWPRALAEENPSLAA